MSLVVESEPGNHATIGTSANDGNAGAEPRSHPVWLGGAAAMMSVTITHPIDQTKIRSQTQKVRQGMLATARQTIRSSGVLGLWTGLSGSMVRQATYGAARFGIYGKLKERDERLRMVGKKEGKQSRLGLVKNGAIAGFIAGIVGAPGELVMVRMSSDGVKPPNQRVNYPSAIHGLYRIAKKEGLAGTFRGLQATCLRSVIMNSSQLSCYDMIKERLLLSGYFNDSVPLHLITSFLGGTIAVTLCAPVDVMKSRIQSSTAIGVSGLDIVKQSLRTEGASVLLRGWLPAWLRMTPTTMLTFAFMEQLKRLF